MPAVPIAVVVPAQLCSYGSAAVGLRGGCEPVELVEDIAPYAIDGIHCLHDLGVGRVLQIITVDNAIDIYGIGPAAYAAGGDRVGRRSEMPRVICDADGD